MDDTTYRVILYKNSLSSEPSLLDYPTYDYRHNDDFSCVEVPTATFCFLKLKYRMECRYFADEYMNMPTYAVMGRI